MRLPIADVREDPAIQLRGGLDMDRVEAMAEFLEQGGQLPPIMVIGHDNLLADGHHRLYVAMTTGRIEIDANRMPGGAPEAVALAIRLNDIATSQPLTRTQRKTGVRLLLEAGWTQDKIGKATGVHGTTISNIGHSLAMRGALTKKVGGKGTPKPVTVLPTEVHEKLNDTVLVRIADSVPLDQQAEFAAAVADAGLSEPRVREAIKALSKGFRPVEAVAEVMPRHLEMPRTLPDVANQVRRRLERFLEEPMAVEGHERDFWAVIDVLAANVDLIPLEAGSLARLLAEVSVKADASANRLNSAKLTEAMA